MTTITTLTSRELDRDTAGAKRAAASGPVVITDRGRPSHVLLSYERYRELSGSTESIVALLAMPEAAVIDFEAPRARHVYRPAEFG
jgi:prevent-host-death family protein